MGVPRLLTRNSRCREKCADFFLLQLAQDASVEARMIAATVFSTLNESWDKFKAENGL